jgi:eukaryotic-like serine/threonine-protein kinase
MNDVKPSLRAVFSEAAEIADPAERAAFLDSACAGNVALRARVEQLLNADSRAGNFLSERPATGNFDFSSEQIGERIGRYRLVEQIGRGGFGAVYLAEQEEPVRRRVALKVIKVGMDTQAFVARFEAERQALALMDHPNIAKVFDAGATNKGRPYFVMEFVPGVPITDYCDQNGLSIRQRLELFIQVCQAVSHAHQKGVIHRDLKPSNILVALHDGAPMAKVIDFGVAKATDRQLGEQATLTGADQFVGTPAYMSPEQVTAGGRDVDTRSDIYSLGVVLYELVTGCSPFDSKELAKAGPDEMRRIIREVDPPRPSTVLTKRSDPNRKPAPVTLLRERLSAVRGDIDWIVMKCLEKDRTRRYETANGLAADLRRHLEHEPVIARPPSGLYRLQKVVRRNRLAFSAAATIFAVLVIAVFVSTRSAFRALRAEQEQTRLRGIAESKASESVERLVRRYVAEGNRLMEEGLPLQALPWMVEALELESSDPERARDERLRIAQSRVGAPELRLHFAQGKWMHAVALSADGHRLAAGSDDGLIRLSEVASGGDTGTNLSLPAAIGTLDFSPDDSRIVGMDMKGNARVWDSSSGEAVTPVLRIEGFNPRSVANPSGRLRPTASFSSDGRFLLLAWGSKSAELRDAATGTLLREFKHADVVYHAAFSSNGQWVVTSSEDRTARVWETASGKPASPALPHSSAVTLAHFNSDASKLLTLREHRFVQLWDWRNGQRIQQELQRRATVNHASFSPDDNRVLTVAGSGMAHLYDVTSTLLVNQFIHPGRLLDAAFSPDGYYAAIACDDGNVWLWDVNDSQRRPMLLPSGNLIEEVAFSGNGRFLAVGSRGGHARVWEVFPPERGVKRLPGHDVQYVEFDSSGGRALLVNTGTRSGLNVYDGVTAKLISTAKFSGREITQAGFSPDGEHIIAFGRTTEPLIIHSDSGKVARRLPHSQRVRSVAWSSDGKFIFTAAGSKAQKWSFDAGEKVLAFAHSNSIRAMALSPDGQWLATGHEDKSIFLWETLTGQREEVRMTTQESICDVHFSPDGKCLAISSHEPPGDGVVEIREVTSGKLVGRPLLHRDDVISFTFSRDGRWVATACADHSARVWDARTGEAVSPWLPHDFEAERVIFSPDASRLVTLARRGAVRLWNSQTGEPLTAPIQYFRNTGDGAVSYSGDGQRLLIARGASEAWLRDLQPEGASREELGLLAKVISCTRFDPVHGMVPLDTASLNEAWKRLRVLRGQN